MSQSEHINELASALSKAQSEMKSAKKTANNPFFKSKYADLTEVWEAARDSICKNGLAVCHTMGKEEGQLMLYTTLMHSSGQWIRSAMPLICKKPDDIQSMASSVTYSKRYSLAAILCICTDDDDDGNEATAPVKQVVQKNEPKIDRNGVLKDIKEILKECGAEYEDKILNHYKVIGIDMLEDKDLKLVMNKSLAFRDVKRKERENASNPG